MHAVPRWRTHPMLRIGVWDALLPERWYRLFALLKREAGIIQKHPCFAQRDGSASSGTTPDYARTSSCTAPIRTSYTAPAIGIVWVD